ncbi:MAG: N-formylglutamate amidohydrolase [Phycisphaerales bacterium]|nr:N-formylglutamate amidohydrolase [Phycisphaerales bacterium]
MASARPFVLLTCEHGGNDVPARYRALFTGHQDLLQSHRGWDPGALDWARLAAKSLKAPLIEHKITRLLVELNRSRRHPALFSGISRVLPPAERERLISDTYTPWRDAVEAQLRKATRRGRVFHISAHSFTPSLNGETRNADIGLLYDPRRKSESDFCRAWQNEITAIRPDLRIRRNYPYRGAADGFTTYLRKAVGPRYSGIELEINQRFPLGPSGDWKKLKCDTIAALQATLTAFGV